MRRLDGVPVVDDLPVRAFEGRSVLITGGAGFMGSDIARAAVAAGARRVCVYDSLTYAGDLARLAAIEGSPSFSFHRGDVRDREELESVFDRCKPDIILHYAAETHVTRSEFRHEHFFDSNVVGTESILEVAVRYAPELFVHISTDEVYGPALTGSHSEGDKLPGEGAATSAYARSKARADDLACSFMPQLPVAVLRFGNVFGAYQYPEKAIARWIARGLTGETLPVWGDGGQVRQWTSLSDHSEAVALVAADHRTGVFNVAGDATELPNLEIASRIARSLGLDLSKVQTTEYDRPSHDRRYSIDTTRIRDAGWRSSPLDDALRATVEWYATNVDWWMSHLVDAESFYRSIEPSY